MYVYDISSLKVNNLTDIACRLPYLGSSRIYSCVNFVLFLMLMWRFVVVKYCFMPIIKILYGVGF